MKYTITLTEWEAEAIRRALGYMALDEVMGKGGSFSWLKIARDFDKKIGKEEQ